MCIGSAITLLGSLISFVPFDDSKLKEIIKHSSTVKIISDKNNKDEKNKKF